MSDLWDLMDWLFSPFDFPGKNTGVGCHILLMGIILTQRSNPCLLCLLHCRQILYCWATREAQQESMCLVAQSCSTLCDPMAWSPPGSSVYGDSPGKSTGVGYHALLQVIFQSSDQTQVFPIAGRFFTVWATREATREEQALNKIKLLLTVT